jgi:hypothetical protein
MVIRGKYVLGETIRASELTIAQDAEITALSGKLLTLTSQGTELPIAPGTYKDAVLSVTEDFPCPVDDFDSKGYRSALYVGKDGIKPERSVTAALQNGSYDEKSLNGVTIKSCSEGFGGVIVDSTDYKISNLTIAMDGTGGNDFSGLGTGVLAAGDARLEIDGLKVNNRGVIRNAVTVADHAVVTVRNADIMTRCGTEEEHKKAKEHIRNMTNVPWALGLVGNVRSTNVVGSGKVTYIDSTIKSDRWGVLSTDGVDDPKDYGDICVSVITENCDVEITGDSGYISYSIGACRNEFRNSRMKSPDYILITANEYAGSIFDGTKAESKRFGIMWHSNQGGKTLIKNSEFKTDEATFLIKGCYPEIEVDSSNLTPANGIILQLMDSDDPGIVKDDYVLEVDNVPPVKDESHNAFGENRTTCNIFGKDRENICTDAKAAFKNVTLNGDFYNSITNSCRVGMLMPPAPAQPGGNAPSGKNPPPKPEPSTNAPINLILSFENTALTGAITSSIAKHRINHIMKEDYRELGEITNTAAPAVNNGVIASFDAASSWVVTSDSYLTCLTIADGAKVSAPDGKALEMTVDGVPTEILPGTYSGEILVKPV